MNHINTEKFKEKTTEINIVFTLFCALTPFPPTLSYSSLVPFPNRTDESLVSCPTNRQLSASRLLRIKVNSTIPET